MVIRITLHKKSFESRLRLMKMDFIAECLELLQKKQLRLLAYIFFLLIIYFPLQEAKMYLQKCRSYKGYSLDVMADGRLF